jgi:hypothetical protein
MRVRLKADGRLVEIMPDGSERGIAAAVSPVTVDESDAAYARRVRAASARRAGPRAHSSR